MFFSDKILKRLNLLNLCFKLFKHIEVKRKKSLIILFLLTLTCAFLEMLSMATVLPFLLILTDPQKIFEIAIIENFLKILGYVEHSEVSLIITIIFLCAIISSMLMRIYLLVFTTRLSFSLGADFGYKIYNNTLHEPYVNHLDRNSNEVVNGIFAKVNQVVYGILLSFLTLLNSSVILLIILSTIFVIDFKITILSLSVFLSLYLLVVLIVNLPLKRHSKIIASFSTKILKNLQEGLGAIKDILLNNNQKFYTQLFRNDDLIFRESQGSVHIISGTPRFLIEGIGMVFIVLAGYYSSITNEGFVDLIPTLGLMVFAAQRSLPLLQQIYSGWSSMKSVENSLIDVLEFLNIDIDVEQKTYQEESLKGNISFKKSIILENVNFKHNNSQTIFSNVNLKIKKGELVGFVGETGAGKSTMVDIITGLLHIKKGSIKIDGKVLTKRNFKIWQNKIAIVPQKLFFVDSTIAENIAFGVKKDEINYNRVIEVTKKAQLINFVTGLSDGFETKIGQNGVKLSGGQKQRLAIARALYRKPEILILDEATSALDCKTEKRIMNIILKLKKQITVISIAHRLSTLENYDVIFKFVDNNVIDMGNYKQFINTK